MLDCNNEMWAVAVLAGITYLLIGWELLETNLMKSPKFGDRDHWAGVFMFSGVCLAVGGSLLFLLSIPVGALLLEFGTLLPPVIAIMNLVACLNNRLSLI